jgi:uncharacterized protein (TIGR00290 family)
MKKVLVSWSSGKDSAWTLHALRQEPDISVGAILTTISEEHDRVTMHGVRRELVEAQAAAIGLPVWTVPIAPKCPDEIYRRRMRGVCNRAVAEGFAAIAFGDLFLEDVRNYRETRLAGTGLEPLFPLWGKPTLELSREMVASGLKAKIACLDPEKIPRNLAGHDFDSAFFAALPAGVDPCAEHGEFHTFVYDSPEFAKPLDIIPGDIVESDGRVFADFSLRE